MIFIREGEKLEIKNLVNGFQLSASKIKDPRIEIRIDSNNFFRYELRQIDSDHLEKRIDLMRKGRLSVFRIVSLKKSELLWERRYFNSRLGEEITPFTFFSRYNAAFAQVASYTQLHSNVL